MAEILIDSLWNEETKSFDLPGNIRWQPDDDDEDCAYATIQALGAIPCIIVFEGGLRVQVGDYTPRLNAVELIYLEGPLEDETNTP